MNKADQSDADALDENCELCGLSLAGSEDNWDGLCPTCADKVSAHLDSNDWNDDDRDDVIQILKRHRE